MGDLVRTQGIELEVANPTHEAWRWKNVKRKTDRDDALKLAFLSAMNQLPTVYLPERRTRQLSFPNSLSEQKLSNHGHETNIFE